MSKSGSEGRGEQTTARKRGIGGSPLTLLPKSQSPEDAKIKDTSAGKTPVTGAVLCGGIAERPPQPRERRAMPSEGIEGDEWGAYVTLGRTTRTNAGSTLGARAPG
jgi:hypothetical protein